MRLVTFLAALSLGISVQACSSDEATEADSNLVQDALAKVPSDSAISKRMNELVAGLDFASEADYPYIVVEGKSGGAKPKLVTIALVRTKLAAAVKKNNDNDRDISKLSVRGELGDKLTASMVASEEKDAKDRTIEVYYRENAAKRAALYKYMLGNLDDVRMLTFGTSENGDQDDEGTAIEMVVGISRTTGKLIGVMAQAVYT